MDIWYDTDPGFDDWMAGPCSRPSPRSACTASAWWRATRLEHHAGQRAGDQALHGFETPVFAGCDRPLSQARVTAQDVLGAMGMETTGPLLPPVDTAPAPGHGVSALIEAVRAHPGASRCWPWGR